MTVRDIGKSVLRVEDERFLTGQARYLDDIEFAGQAYAFIVRSPHPHAIIKSVECTEAAQAAGVLAIATASDLARDRIGSIPCSLQVQNRNGSWSDPPPRPLLADGFVRHVGEEVAVVVAETLVQARDAAELVSVVYEVLPANVDHSSSSLPT